MIHREKRQTCCSWLDREKPGVLKSVLREKKKGFYCPFILGTSVPLFWNKQGESPLQIQIQKMFDKICEKTNCHGRTRELIESTLSGYFIPFRSPSRNDLKHKKEAFDFGEKIWLRILKTVQPKLFVCIEKETAKRIRKIIETAYDLPESKSYKLQTGWGNYTADIFEFGNNAEVKLLRLPHLSRFTLFTSEKCEEKIKDIFTQFCGTS